MTLNVEPDGDGFFLFSVFSPHGEGEDRFGRRHRGAVAGEIEPLMSSMLDEIARLPDDTRLLGIRALGAKLWDLVPDGIRQLITTLGEERHLHDVAVLSGDLFTPWELMQSPGDSRTPLGARCDVAVWPPSILDRQLPASKFLDRALFVVAPGMKEDSPTGHASALDRLRAVAFVEEFNQPTRRRVLEALQQTAARSDLRRVRVLADKPWPVNCWSSSTAP